MPAAAAAAALLLAGAASGVGAALTGRSFAQPRLIEEKGLHGILYAPPNKDNVEPWQVRAGAAPEPRRQTRTLGERLAGADIWMPTGRQRVRRKLKSGVIEDRNRVVGSESEMLVVYTASVPAEARDAIEAALKVWGDLFSAPEVRIHCGWEAMGSGVLASAAGSYYIPGSIAGANRLDDNTIYSSPLAMSIQGRDFLPPDLYHINLVFNSDVPWNFGKRNAPWNTYDLTTVALHEQCHGLFFDGLVNVADDDVLTVGIPEMPDRFDRFLRATDGGALLDTCRERRAGNVVKAITAPGLRFHDPTRGVKRGGLSFPLYAPREYEAGSSTYHHDPGSLDEACEDAGIAAEDCSDLMTPALLNGYTNRKVGEPVLAMLRSLRGSSFGARFDSNCK